MQIFGRVDDSAWWDVARKCDAATFYHSPLWSIIARRTHSQLKDATIAAVTPRGTRVVFPLLRRRRITSPLSQEVQSTFDGSYGGLIFDGPLSMSEQAQIFNASIRRFRISRLQINGNPLLDGLRGGQPIKKDEIYTHVVALDPDFDIVYGRFSRGNRIHIERGYGAGVSVRSSRNWFDYKTFVKLYKRSRADQADRDNYPKRLIGQIHRMAKDFPNHIRLWLAEWDGQVIGGAIVFYWNEHVAFWQAFFDDRFFHLRARNVIQAAIIQNACETGYKYYDLNPKGRGREVTAFKKSFGSDPYPLIRIAHRQNGPRSTNPGAAQEWPSLVWN